MRNILIYRHQLFKPSEVFISSQAGALRRFRPVYIGRESSPPPSPGVKLVTLNDADRCSFIRHVMLRDPGPLVKRVRAYSPALIHAHFGVEGLYALGIARRLNVPLITTFHGFDATITKGSLLRSCKPSWIHYALFRKQLTRHGDLFICVSDYILERVIAAGFPEKRVVRHYIGIDTDAIRPAEKQDTSKTIVHVARLVENKGTWYLIKAFRLISETHPEAKLLIIGDGPLRSSLEKIVHSYQLSGRVRFLGTCSNKEVLKMISDSTVFSLPSVTLTSGIQEGFGMVILEASAAGVPTVATMSGGIPEVVQDGITGYLVPERDVDALAERISHLLGNPRLCEKMGHAARQMAVDKFNLKKQTALLEELYETVF